MFVSPSSLKPIVSYIVQLVSTIPNGVSLCKSQKFLTQKIFRRRESVVPWYLVPKVYSVRKVILTYKVFMLVS